MGIAVRGIKNAFRNSTRTISIVFILAISIALALIMLMSMKAVQTKIDTVKSSVGNTITVSPAGIQGFEGGGSLLTNTDLSEVSALPHVASTTATLGDRLTTTDTNLVASLSPGSFGNRQRSQDSQSFGFGGGGAGASGATGTFTMPITVTGINNLSNDQALNISSFKLTSGSTINANSSSDVALLGKDLASKNKLTVGSTFQAYGKTITVAGIFDSGNTFTNSALIMPLATVQTLSSQASQISSILVQTDSVDNLSSVQNAIKAKLGSSADVVTSQQTAEQAVQPLENIKTLSLYSLIGAIAAGSVIIFLTMVMIVRERRREIGVLKAIGASNVKITLQFAFESLTLTLLAAIVGFIGGLIFGNPVLNAMVSNSTTSTSTSGGGARFGGGGGGGAFITRSFGGAGSAVRNTLQNLHTVVGVDTLLLGLAAALVIAIVGSSIPAYFISKVRPAEVMRTE
jgi:putative ABC transport system permease protein